MEYLSKKKFPVNSRGYKLYEEVGEGVSATVYRALCIPFNEIVAVKVLDLERRNSDLVCRLFATRNATCICIILIGIYIASSCYPITTMFACCLFMMLIIANSCSCIVIQFTSMFWEQRNLKHFYVSILLISTTSIANVLFIKCLSFRFLASLR